MSSYDFNIGENVLLLGEGNFSFSVELINYSKKNVDTKFDNVYTTCFEEAPHSPDMIKNIQILRESGVHVVLGVDATKLSSNPLLRDIRFKKIIFNFPHVGGKMKIHLNRKLLSDFFTSCSESGGSAEVLVALCAGQGGTGAEDVERRWADSWQVVEMAAHGDYLLTDLRPFPHHLFTNYISTGFRGREKSFNTEKALIYHFSQSSPPPTDIGDVSDSKEVSVEGGSLVCSPVFADKIDRDPIRRKDSPQSFVITLLENILSRNVGEFKYRELYLPLYVEKGDGPECRLGDSTKHLRNSLFEALPQSLEVRSVVLFTGLVFNRLSSDFSLPPATCEALLVGDGVSVVCRKFVDETDRTFGIRERFRSLNGSSSEYETFFTERRISLGDRETETCTLDLDVVCFLAFGLESWRELWVGSSVQASERPSVSLPSLYPPTFTFDICFSVDSSFTEDKFYQVLRETGEDMIESASLVSVYDPPGSAEKSYCYRIVYKSYRWPLFRKRVVAYHLNVISKALTLKLNATVS